MIIIVVLIVYISLSIFFDQTTSINEFYSLGGIALISFFLVTFLYKNYKQFAVIIILGYLLRIVILFSDYFELFTIPFSGADSEKFYDIAYSNVVMGTDRKLTNFSVYLTALFKIIGPQRLFAQYINVLFGICTIIYTYKSLALMNVDNVRIKKALLLVSFFPQMMIFSSILLRETIIICCTTISLFYFLSWLKQKRLLYMMLTIGFILISAYMHSGMIGMLFGYFYAFIFYNHSKKQFVYRAKALISFTIASSFFLVVIMGSGLFTGYFSSLLDAESSLSSEEVLLDKLSAGDAGSAYLTWLDVTNPAVAILATPLRMFYFLFSPLPMDWRNLLDIVTFFVDSLVYFMLLYFIFKNISLNNHCFVISTQVRSILLGYFLYVLIYGIGTSAAGTALRHRSKCFPLLVVVYSVMVSKQMYLSETVGSKSDNKG